MKHTHVALLAALIVGVFPSAAAADTFQQKSEQARLDVASRSIPSLESLNNSAFIDAHIAAKIIGYDRSEIEQMKREIAQLRAENVQLRGQAPATTHFTGNLEARVAALEIAMDGMQGTLGKVITMLTLFLTKMQ
jgi:hypothetical protein